MIVEQTKILRFLGQEDVCFSISPEGGSYCWDVEQCQKLWNDIMHAADAGKRCFFGVFAYREDEQCGGMREVCLEEGRQRVQAMILLLSALCDCLKGSPHTSYAGADADFVTRHLLGEPGARKVTHAPCDAACFEAALAGEGASGDLRQVGGGESINPHVMASKRYFAEAMSAPDFDVAKLWRGLGLFDVVEVGFTLEEAASCVFEAIRVAGASESASAAAEALRAQLL